MKVKSFGVKLPQIDFSYTLAAQRIAEWERKQIDGRIVVKQNTARRCKRSMFDKRDADKILRKFGVR